MKSILFRSECVICLTLCNIIQHCHSISGKRYCLAQLPGILIWYDLLLGSNSISQVENFKSLISKKNSQPHKKKKNNQPLTKEKKKKTENPQNIFSNQGSEWTMSGIVYSYNSSKSIILIILRQRFPACFDKIFYLDKLIISYATGKKFGAILHFFKNTLKYICIYLKIKFQ